MVKKRPFQVFARFYNTVVESERIPYAMWLKFIKKAIRLHHLKPKVVFDFACGTGNFSFPLEEMGFSVKGFDISKEMINIAKEKAKKRKSKIQFFVQDVRAIEIRQSAGLVVCMFDSLNHLANENDLLKAFHSAYSALKKGGLFIFDLNAYKKFVKKSFPTERIQKFEKFLLIHYNDYAFPFWLNHLVLAVKEPRVGYLFYEEIHRERAFKMKRVLKMLGSTGFSQAECFGDGVPKRATENSNRWFFTAKK